MSDAEKIVEVKLSCGEEVTDALVASALARAKDTILARRFPFVADPSACEWPTRYDSLQCEIAAFLIGKRGAEGETSHKENGIDRVWATDGIPTSMLRRVIPFAGVPD